MRKQLDASDTLWVRLAKETVIETMGTWDDATFDAFIASVRRQYKARQEQRRQRLTVVDGSESAPPSAT